LTLPNGVTVAYSYDPDGHVTGITYRSGGTQLGNLTYTYDADGRMTSKDGSLVSTGMPAPVSGNAFNAFGGSIAACVGNRPFLGCGVTVLPWYALLIMSRTGIAPSRSLM